MRNRVVLQPVVYLVLISDFLTGIMLAAVNFLQLIFDGSSPSLIACSRILFCSVLSLVFRSCLQRQLSQIQQPTAKRPILLRLAKQASITAGSRNFHYEVAFHASQRIENTTSLFDIFCARNVVSAHLLAAKAMLMPSKGFLPKVDCEAFFITDGSPLPFWDLER